MCTDRNNFIKNAVLKFMYFLIYYFRSVKCTTMIPSASKSRHLESSQARCSFFSVQTYYYNLRDIKSVMYVLFLSRFAFNNCLRRGRSKFQELGFIWLFGFAFCRIALLKRDCHIK